MEKRVKVKGAKFLYLPWGEGDPFGRGGGDFQFSGVREVGISGR